MSQNNHVNSQFNQEIIASTTASLTSTKLARSPDVPSSTSFPNAEPKTLSPHKNAADSNIVQTKNDCDDKKSIDVSSISNLHSEASSSSDSDSNEQLMGRGIPSKLNDEEIFYPFGESPRSLRDVARFIESKECKSIVILAGAGMSVASGIPDFRSAGGLYDTLKPSLLTATEAEREAIRDDPTIALEMGLFLQNPLPCLELNRPFILGTRDKEWKATLAHRFVELLHTKTGKLTRLYQQNIDGLESQCSHLPREKVVMVHGSMDEADCALCGTKMDFQSFTSHIERHIKDLTGLDPNAPCNSSPLACDACGYNSVKPSIVLFRSPLPKEFFECVPNDLPNVDLLIIIGTSLAVAPANTLVFRIPQTAMRVVINREPVGFRLGIDYSEYSQRDYFAEGEIESTILDLCQELGWLDDIEKFSDQLPACSAEFLKARRHNCSSESCRKRAKVENHS